MNAKSLFQDPLSAELREGLPQFFELLSQVATLGLECQVGGPELPYLRDEDLLLRLERRLLSFASLLLESQHVFQNFDLSQKYVSRIRPYGQARKKEKRVISRTPSGIERRYVTFLARGVYLIKATGSTSEREGQR